jgi:hypothetical protein
MLTLTPQEIDCSNLSPAELSGLVDMVQAQIEYHRDEIVRLRPILRRLQERIPDDYNNLVQQVRAVLNNLD